jgi:hypothetical protein
LGIFVALAAFWSIILALKLLCGLQLENKFFSSPMPTVMSTEVFSPIDSYKTTSGCLRSAEIFSATKAPPVTPPAHHPSLESLLPLVLTARMFYSLPTELELVIIVFVIDINLHTMVGEDFLKLVSYEGRKLQSKKAQSPQSLQQVSSEERHPPQTY